MLYIVDIYITGKTVNQEQIFTEEVVKRLIFDSAPEKTAEFNHIWEENSINVRYAIDRSGFYLKAGAYGLVLFTQRTMWQIWLAGFAAQKAFHLYSPALWVFQHKGWSLSKESLKHDDEYLELYSECNKQFSDILVLNEMVNIKEFQWPTDVPIPDEGRPSDLKGKMGYDLLCMAGAYCFLHEVRHVLLQNENANLNAHDEEMECDRYAREFLLSNIEGYSEQSGDDIDKVKTKRAMSIAIWSLLQLVITPKCRWFDSPSHPSVIERIKALAVYLELPENDLFWIYLSSLLLAQIELHDIHLEPKVIQSQKSFLYELLETINAAPVN